MNPSKIYKIITAPLRAKPNTFIIGAQKAGTSSLHAYLAKHPKIISGSDKEIHYFSGGLSEQIDNYKRGNYWYRSHYPINLNFNAEDAVLDSTPFYSFHPLAANRIKQFCANAKIIFLLRDPVERAISHYYHTLRHGFEQNALLDAMKIEDSRLENIKASKNFKALSYRVHSYKSRGLYLEQIQQYLKHFNKEQLLILSSEHFFKQPKITTEKVTEFLELDFAPLCQNSFDSHNVGNNKQHVSDEARTYLREYFKKPNKELYKFLGESFEWQ